MRHGPDDGLSVAFVFRHVNRQVRVNSNGNMECDDDSSDLDILDDLLDDFAENTMHHSETMLRTSYTSMKDIYN